MHGISVFSRSQKRCRYLLMEFPWSNGTALWHNVSVAGSNVGVLWGNTGAPWSNMSVPSSKSRAPWSKVGVPRREIKELPGAGATGIGSCSGTVGHWFWKYFCSSKEPLSSLQGSLILLQGTKVGREGPIAPGDSYPAPGDYYLGSFIFAPSPWWLP